MSFFKFVLFCGQYTLDDDNAWKAHFLDLIFHIDFAKVQGRLCANNQFNVIP